MAGANMSIVGGFKNLLWDALRTHSACEVLGVYKDRVLVEPAVVSYQVSAPNSKRKYGVVTLKLGFLPSIFENNLKSVEALYPENLGFTLFASVQDKYLSDEGKQYASETEKYLEEVFVRYPKLGELFNEFLEKWEAAYAEAVGATRKDDAEGEMGTEEASTDTE